MHPRDVLVRAVVHLHAVRPEALDAPGDVLALEADEVNALAVLREKAPDGLGRIGRLEQLDVADPRRQDRVLEAELLGLRAVMNAEPEDPRVPLDRRVEVATTTDSSTMSPSTILLLSPGRFAGSL